MEFACNLTGMRRRPDGIGGASALGPSRTVPVVFPPICSLIEIRRSSRAIYNNFWGQPAIVRVRHPRELRRLAAAPHDGDSPGDKSDAGAQDIPTAQSCRLGELNSS